MTGDPARASAESADAATGTIAPAVAAPIWDVPLRAFHWLLVGLVIANVVTGKIGGNRLMEIHVLSGYAILTLVLFRLAWGFVGGHHARFAAFVRGPAAVWNYARDLAAGRTPRFLGHNPLGGWSVLAMLAVLLVQAGTGLCANDDILVEGPLARKVGKETSDLLTYVHYLSSNVLLTLVVLHVGAVLFYLAKGDNLTGAMLSGRKRIDGAHVADATGPRANGNLWLAAAALAVAVGAVWAIVRI